MKLHRQIIPKFKRRKFYSSFRDNIQGVDLADMQIIKQIQQRIKYLLYAIDLLSKCMCVVPLKRKRGITIVNAFQKIISKNVNQIKYGLIKTVNFTIIFLRGF